MDAAKRFDVAVIGAGAAGLMCAATAAKRGRNVVLIERNAEPGAKILISGGGRCNFTNRDIAPENFISANPRFCRSALAGYTQHDFLAMVTEHGIAYHEKKLGQLFCDISARQILSMLLDHCAPVDLRLSHQITAITKPERFCIETDQGIFVSDSLVLATGGLSIPKMGATGFTYAIAEQFGLALTDIRPGLVPLTFEGESWAWMQGLSGVSFDSTVQAGKTMFREHTLFTHRGLSGPAFCKFPLIGSQASRSPSTSCRNRMHLRFCSNAKPPAQKRS